MKQITRFFKRKSVQEILGNDFIPSEQQIHRLLLILDSSEKVKQFEDWLPAFANFIKYDLTNYRGRFRRLRQLPASPSLYSLILRYGKQEALHRHIEYGRKRTSHLDTKIDHWLQNGFSFNEAKEQIRRVQTERAMLSAQVLRGSSEYTIRSIAYWLRHGFSKEDARKKVRDIQATNGIAAYKRRGDISPEQSQIKRNAQWLATLSAKPIDERHRIKLAKSHTVEGCMARGLNPDEAESKSINYYRKRGNCSRISSKCFAMVADRIGADSLYFKALNYEKQFAGKNVDFYDHASKIVIEFFGDFWHGNPQQYDGQFLIYGKPACYVQADDRARFARIEKHPLVEQIYLVWESEFRHNPTEVVNYIVETLILGRSGK